MKECVLYDRECINCGECLHCDLDPEKICDNCGHCLDTDGKEYNEIKIDGIDLSGDEYQKWLAEQLNVNQTTVSKWCTNTSQPDLATLKRISELLDVNVSEIINFD